MTFVLVENNWIVKQETKIHRLRIGRINFVHWILA